MRSRTPRGAGLLACALLAVAGPASHAIEFSLGFEGCPAEVTGMPGEVKTFEVFATLTTTDNPEPNGTTAWSISVIADGGRIKAISLQGVRVVVVPEVGLPGVEEEMDLSEAPFQVAELARDGGPGAVSAVALRGNGRLVTLKPEGTQRIARLTIEAVVPSPGEAQAQVKLRFVNGVQGSGEPVDNVVSRRGVSYDPELGSCMVRLRPASLFRRGDTNGDSRVNIADPVNTLRHLFTGAGQLPCRSSADANDDGKLDITDPVSLLKHLFQGRFELPPPAVLCAGDPTPDALSCDDPAPCLTSAAGFALAGAGY